MMSDFKLKYIALDVNGNQIKSGTVICKQKMSKFAAICGYENYLKKKNPKVDKVRAIRCIQKTLLGYLDIDFTAPNSNPFGF